MTSADLPYVIATLPARSLDAARREATLAREAGADLAEVRFDRWPARERESPERLFPAPLPLIATLRSAREGGEGPDDVDSRRRWRDRVAGLPFAFVDLEGARDLPEPATRLSPRAEGRWIVSWHLPPATSPTEVHRRLSGPRPVGSVLKVVVPAGVSTAVSELVPSLPPAGEGARILHTTGPSGPLLRAWARRLGLAGVFGALPEGGAEAPVEPSQIPVDRLRWFLEGRPEAPLFAVAGRPIGHSRSPALHSTWMRALGDHGLYVALELASEREFAEMLEPLARGGFRGLNVTHPFKAEALRAATRGARGAESCGCANTLTFEDGDVVAENTDLLAILRRLGELEREGTWAGRRLTVVGTGGAARATLAAGRSLGAELEVVGRRPDAARELAAEFGARVSASPSPTPCDLLVHATTVGRGPGTLEVDLESRVGPETFVLDWVYRPERAVLAETVAAAGGRYEDGRRLLAYSAAASYEIWWDHAPPDGLLEKALAEVA